MTHDLRRVRTFNAEGFHPIVTLLTTYEAGLQLNYYEFVFSFKTIAIGGKNSIDIDTRDEYPVFRKVVFDFVPFIESSHYYIISKVTKEDYIERMKESDELITEDSIYLEPNKFTFSVITDQAYRNLISMVKARPNNDLEGNIFKSGISMVESGNDPWDPRHRHWRSEIISLGVTNQVSDDYKDLSHAILDFLRYGSIPKAGHISTRNICYLENSVVRVSFHDFLSKIEDVYGPYLVDECLPPLDQ